MLQLDHRGLSSPLWWDMDGEGSCVGTRRVVLRCCDLFQPRFTGQEGQGLVAFGSWRINGGINGGTSLPWAQRLERGSWQEAVGLNPLGSISPPNCSNKKKRGKKTHPLTLFTLHSSFRRTKDLQVQICPAFINFPSLFNLCDFNFPSLYC